MSNTEKKKSVELSVVVPVYRSASTLVELTKRLIDCIEPLNLTYEILYIDDESPDDSWNLIQSLAAKNPAVRGIQLLRNYGQQRAVLCGLSNAKGSFVVTMDADLQHLPEDIPRLLASVKSGGQDAVIASFREKRHGIVRNFGTWLVRIFYKYAFGLKSDLDLTSFRVIRQSVVEEMCRSRNHNPVIGYLILQVTNRVENLPVDHAPRKNDASSYRFSFLLRYFWTMLLDYSDLPLRTVGVLGVFFSFASFSFGGFFLFKYMVSGSSVSGFTSTILLISFLFGLVFMALSVIGAYLGRILSESNNPSLFIERAKTISCDEQELR